MSWTLLHEGVPVARLTRVDLDQPWFVCDFRREPAFAPDGDEAEWLEMHATLRHDDEPSQPTTRTFLLSLDGDVAYLRY